MVTRTGVPLSLGERVIGGLLAVLLWAPVGIFLLRESDERAVALGVETAQAPRSIIAELSHW
jgi:hypothetical protein